MEAKRIKGAKTYIFMLMILFVSCLPLQSQPVSNNLVVTEAELKSNMRELWEDHIIWTRNVILNIMDELPGTDIALARLLKNQQDIGNAIKPFYGEEAGTKLTQLLNIHINTAGNLLKAVKDEDKTAFNKANKDWYSNADEIAAFLAAANPNWTFDEMKGMMHEHLKVTTDEAMARFNKDYAADVKAFDTVQDQILVMSDMLSEGIIKQYPDRFSSQSLK